MSFLKLILGVVALCTLVYGEGNLITKDPGCGVSLGCYHDCNQDDCDFMITWSYSEEFEAVKMSMSKVVSSPYDQVWFGMGLSYDKSMGDDSVIECSTDSQMYWLAGAKHSYNVKHYNVDFLNAYHGLRQIRGRMQDGILQCNFTRMVYSEGVDRVFDLDRPWYLLVAYGNSRSGIKHGHALREAFPFISPMEVDLREHVDLSVRTSFSIAKAHGCLMIFAWLTLASISIVVARLFRRPWYTGTKDHRNMWHLTHKSLMACVALCTLVSFVMIWSSTRGYSKLRGSHVIQRAHPVLGVAIMGLTLLNPMIALLRPSKAIMNQATYKYTHGFVGAVLFVLAVLNILLGVTLPQADAPSYVLWLVIGFAGYQVFFHAILELCDFYLIRSGKLIAYEAAKNTRDVTSNSRQNPPGMVPKLILLSVHVVISIGVGVCSIVFISM